MRSTRRGAGRHVLALLGVVVAIAGLLGLAPPASATPWGSAGADYDGVLCSIDGSDVPPGAWTVNGSVRAYSTQDIQGRGPLQQPAPFTGTAQTMTPGQAGYSAADIATVAYLLHAQQDASGVRAAEVSAAVASLTAGGLQSRCLGQGGTSAGRARGLLDTARRLAGPYTVEVTAPGGAIPGQSVQIGVRVRSAAGAGVPGIQVSLTGGGSLATLTTGRSGTARTTVVVPAAARTTLTATAAVPAELVYLGTTPPSVATGPLRDVAGSATLQPVLHPRPTVSVGADELVLAEGTVRAQVQVGGTFGYSGSGEVTLLGPVRPAGGAACSTVSDADLAKAGAPWQDTFTFRGDAGYRAAASPSLAPGCYGLRATVTTSDSSPPERAVSSVVPVTVASLKLAATGAKAAAPGGLAATVVGTDPGRATVRTTLSALGPLPVRRGGCTGDFGSAPVAGSSGTSTLRASGGQLRAQLAVPSVKATGCYALISRSQVSLDGRSAKLVSAPTAAATTAILRPVVAATPTAASNEQGRPMTGTVQLSGTFGFAGTLAVGLVEGSTLPISGCRDAAFPMTGAGATSRVTTKGDGSYPFRTPAAVHNACYAVTATFTLAGNTAVVVRSAAPDASTAFLAGVRPDAGAGSVVQQPGKGGILRATITYLVFGLLLLGGCGALFARTLRDERDQDDETRLWRWRPNRSDDAPRPPRPGNGSRRRPMPTAEPPGVL